MIFFIVVELPSFDGQKLPLCNSTNSNEFKCPKKMAETIWYEVIRTDGCPKPCSILYYQGKVTLKQKYPRSYVASEHRDEAARIKFSYGFASPELVDVHQEFLVYDTIGMIGSVGGTLGMCIGFSFTSSISFVLNVIKKLNFN